MIFYAGFQWFSCITFVEFCCCRITLFVFLGFGVERVFVDYVQGCYVYVGV